MTHCRTLDDIFRDPIEDHAGKCHRLSGLCKDGSTREDSRHSSLEQEEPGIERERPVGRDSLCPRRRKSVDVSQELRMELGHRLRTSRRGRQDEN